MFLIEEIRLKIILTARVGAIKALVVGHETIKLRWWLGTQTD